MPGPGCHLRPCYKASFSWSEGNKKPNCGGVSGDPGSLRGCLRRSSRPCRSLQNMKIYFRNSQTKMRTRRVSFLVDEGHR